MNPYILMTRINIKEKKRWNLDNLFGNSLNSKIGMAFALLLILGGFYIFQANGLAVLGYELKEKEKEVAKTRKEMSYLQIKTEEEKAALSLRAKVQNLNMVESTKISYIYVSGGGLAMADGGNLRGW